MSQLITVSGLLALTDITGAIYKDIALPIDAANAHAMQVSSTLVSVFADDIDQALAWYPAARALYAGTSPTTATGLFGANATGAFGGGQGLLSRNGMVPAVLFSWLEKVRRQIQIYGTSVDSSVADLVTFAAYHNTSAPVSCLFSPDFAAAYWTAYGGARQLDASSVFAPTHTTIGACTITAANTSTFTDSYPRTNGYSTPTPSTDSYGNAVYVGGLPVAQGFAPPVSAQVVVTTAISGTCAVTISAHSETGAVVTWTASLDNLASGSVVALTPSITGARIGGAITSLSVVGTATAGSATIRVSANERSIS